MQEIIKGIANKCGITVTGYQQVNGGDINTAYCLHTKDSNYFLKLNDAARFPEMFTKEAAGLEALRTSSSLVVPHTIASGILQEQQWLLLQWIEKGTVQKDSMANFGAALAAMHRQEQPFFGWTHDNYIGSLHQTNKQHSQWHSFYAECRILPLVRILFNNGLFSKADTVQAETFCKHTVSLFPPEPPSLLHGDLWAGNYMADANGRAAIFDPAVYYGHREMDLAMTKLFGGFDDSFYHSYHLRYPLQDGWQQRLPAGQLYPLLVHAVLFGGHYTLRAKEIFRYYS